MSLSEYTVGSILGRELVNSIPEIEQFAAISVEQFSNIGSQDITPSDWAKLANRINTIFEQDLGVSGVVITHGTATLEETAYFLNLTVKHDRPVVLVGAQRPTTAISADGPLNLINAIRVATCSQARGKGTLVVMNDEINCARDVTKNNTYRLEAFRSGELGFLGYVDPDKVSFYRAPTKRHTTNSDFDIRDMQTFPQVEIVYSYAQPRATILRALHQQGVRGIVIAGSGAGIISRFEKQAIEEILLAPKTLRPIIVRSNRTGNGRVIERTDLDALEMIPADNLNPQKARILLMLGLTRTSDVRELKQIFCEY